MIPTITLSRRQFLFLGLVATLTPRRAFAVPRRSPVVLIRTEDRQEGIRQALKLLDFPSLQGQEIILKPNLNSADPFPGSTHPDTLEALVGELKGRGVRGITVADRSGMGGTRGVMAVKGVFAQGERLGFRAVVLDELPAEAWVRFRLSGGHWGQGVLYPKLFTETPSIVQTCCLKTHRFGGHFTLSLKNSVGIVAKHDPVSGYNYMAELHDSPHQRQMIAETNLLYRPALVLLDGIEAFVDGGPEVGRLVKPRVILAGVDRVAIDAVGVAVLKAEGGNRTIMGRPIFQQDQIVRALELGLGVRGPEEIELVTPDPESRRYADRLRRILDQG